MACQKVIVVSDLTSVTMSFLVSACCEEPLFDELAPHAVNATTDAVASVAFTKDLNFIFLLLLLYSFYNTIFSPRYGNILSPYGFTRSSGFNV